MRGCRDEPYSATSGMTQRRVLIPQGTLLDLSDELREMALAAAIKGTAARVPFASVARQLAALALQVTPWRAESVARESDPNRDRLQGERIIS
jgi:hypothetical protein